MPTKIEWTDETWNPITGCSVVSPGCTNCYAMKLAGSRLKNHPSRVGLTDTTNSGPVWNGTVRFNAEWLDQPMRWTRPRRIFVCAHGDLFHERVPLRWIMDVFDVMKNARRHQFQVLTKRASRMRSVLGVMKEVLPNVWLGVSAEDQQRADERVPLLLDTPAAVRFVSAEPLLGPIDFGGVVAPDFGDGHDWPTGYGIPRGWPGVYNVLNGSWWPAVGDPDEEERDAIEDGLPKLDWVIAGGESQPGSRPTHPDWFRSIRDQCADAGTPFHFKQWGDWIDWRSAGAGHWTNKTRFRNDGAVRGKFKGSLGMGERPLYGGREFESRSMDGGEIMVRLGKTRAGRILDGREWSEFPA